MDKDLVYVGKAGTGFTTSMILELARLLRPITLAKDAAIEEARPKKQDRPLGSAEILVGGRVPRHHD